MRDSVTLFIVFLASTGLFVQCVANLRTQSAAFLAFPIALFLLMPYPLWAAFAIVSQDRLLLAAMVALGLPSVWLSNQYFRHEWPKRAGRLAGEDKVAILLLVVGLALLGWLLVRSNPMFALGTTAAFFTACLVIYSFLVKLWRVSRGCETVDGVKWLALVSLALLYGAMMAHGQNRGFWALQVAYGFGEVCVVTVIVYKLSATRSANGDRRT